MRIATKLDIVPNDNTMKYKYITHLKSYIHTHFHMPITLQNSDNKIFNISVIHENFNEISSLRTDSKESTAKEICRRWNGLFWSLLGGVDHKSRKP